MQCVSAIFSVLSDSVSLYGSYSSIEFSGENCLLSIEFSRQEYWNWFPCPPPGDLLDPEMEPMSLMYLHWQAGSLPPVPLGKESDLSRVRLFATPRNVAHQMPPSTDFSKQEYWRGLPTLGKALYLVRVQ